VAILTPALAGTAAMVCAVFLVRWILPAGWPPAWILSIEVAAGGAAYASILLGFYRPLALRYVDFIRRIRNDRDAAIVAEV
jgi:hypothetical protein